MSILWEELAAGFSGPEAMVRVTLRLIVAMLVGAVIGIQRERAHKPAGLRTPMLGASGAAVVVLGGGEFGMNAAGNGTAFGHCYRWVINDLFGYFFFNVAATIQRIAQAF